jgi:hypothetical protein
MAGITVKDCPLQFIPLSKRTPESHSILTSQVKIQLKLRGVISYFDTRRPTEEEIHGNRKYPHIEMTSLNTWDPYNEDLGTDEYQLTNIGNSYQASESDNHIISILTSNLCSISNSYDDESFLTLLQRKVIISVTNTVRRGTVNAKELAEKWFIGLNTAQRTIEQSTQRGVRDYSSTAGYKRLKHTSHQLMYRHIRAAIHTDTMFTKIKY